MLLTFNTSYRSFLSFHLSFTLGEMEFWSTRSILHVIPNQCLLLVKPNGEIFSEHAEIFQVKYRPTGHIRASAAWLLIASIWKLEGQHVLTIDNGSKCFLKLGNYLIHKIYKQNTNYIKKVLYFLTTMNRQSIYRIWTCVVISSFT